MVNKIEKYSAAEPNEGVDTNQLINVNIYKSNDRTLVLLITESEFFTRFVYF